MPTATAKNKVRFGLSNVHYAIITEDAQGVITYATPVRFPGAKALELEPKGDTTDFYADDVLYYTTSTNQGYEATLEVAEITEAFRKDVLGETLDEIDKVLTEKSDARQKKVALLFEFDGDVKATRHVLYACTVTRPGIGSESKSEGAEPGTSELTLVAAPRATDKKVKTSTTTETPAAVYDAWYTKVYEKVVTS